MVAQKFEILLEMAKRTVHWSALCTHSDKKQGFTVPRGKQRCMENGLCNSCKFLYVFCVFVFTTNLFLSTRHDFFYSIHFENLNLRNIWLNRNTILIRLKLFLTTYNQERKSWACLGQTCSRSLIVFLSQFFIIVLIIFGCFWRIHFS